MEPTNTTSVVGQFNEAVLHTFFLRQRLAATVDGHSLDCVNPFIDGKVFCQSHADSRLKKTYAARFNFQSLLATKSLPGVAISAQHSLPQWEAALAILRAAVAVGQLNPKNIQFYSTCSENPVFNDIPSAVLSAAVASKWGAHFLSRAEHGSWIARSQAQPTAFWVALCACVLGDLQLFETHIRELATNVEGSVTPGLTTLFVKSQPATFLQVAIKHAKLPVVTRLLEQHPNIMAETQKNDPILLRAAIFSSSNEVLKAVLDYTPDAPGMLIHALWRYRTLLPRSSSGAETIRLLTRHFSPLHPEARYWLIMHSCAVGDVTLLEDFMSTGPLFHEPIDDAAGRIPTCMPFAIRCGNVDCLRFLLDHGAMPNQSLRSLASPTEHALSYNQLECYRELYQRCPGHDSDWNSPRSIRFFTTITSAENSEEFIAEFIRKEPFYLIQSGYSNDGLQPTLAQRAFWNAQHRLRPGNLKFLLERGVRPLLWQPSTTWQQFSHDPLEIHWPYFNMNREAFLSVQTLLDAFNLPKLRIIV